MGQVVVGRNASVAAGVYGIASGIFALLPCQPVWSFPDKPVRIIVPLAAGGNADILGRALARRLADTFGQNVIVDNRAGGATILGTEMVAKAPPDGYTLLLAGTSHVTNSTIFKRLPYNTLKDFAGVTLIATAPLLLLSHASVPANSVNELIALARARPGQLTFASAGVGGGSHLATELFRMTTGVELIHVPYKGSAPAMSDLLGGQVSIMFETIIGGLTYVKSRTSVKALAVTSAQRSLLLPEVPTLAEAGVAGYESKSWYGVMAPSATPRTVISRLNSAMVNALKQPEMQERLLAQGGILVANTADEFDRFLRAEADKWAKVINAANIRPE